MKDLVKDVDGKLSSKRAIAFGCFGLLTLTIIADLFMGRTLTDYIFNGLEFILIASVGFTGLESLPQFKKRKEEPPIV